MVNTYLRVVVRLNRVCLKVGRREAVKAGHIDGAPPEIVLILASADDLKGSRAPGEDPRHGRRDHPGYPCRAALHSDPWLRRTRRRRREEIAYQGFNDGTVYPQKRGENYIYEGLILRFMKSHWQYHDATNVVGYYSSPVIARRRSSIPAELEASTKNFFSGASGRHRSRQRPSAWCKSTTDLRKTLWVSATTTSTTARLPVYGKALVRLIDFIRDARGVKHRRPKPKVNIIAHSMGGLHRPRSGAVHLSGARRARRRAHQQDRDARHAAPGNLVPGSPGLDRDRREQELEQFNPDRQTEPPKTRRRSSTSHEHFPPERLLTVVGTNYRTYGPAVASWLNRLFSSPASSARTTTAATAW